MSAEHPGSRAGQCVRRNKADEPSVVHETDCQKTRWRQHWRRTLFFLEVSMLSLRRFPVMLIAGAMLALALPVRAAEVDKYLPEDTEIVVVVNAKQLLDSPVVKRHFLKQIREVINSNDQITEILDDLEFDPFSDLTSITVALTMIGSDAKGLIIAHGAFDKDNFEDKAEEV